MKQSKKSPNVIRNVRLKSYKPLKIEVHGGNTDKVVYLRNTNFVKIGYLNKSTNASRIIFKTLTSKFTTKFMKDNNPIATNVQVLYFWLSTKISKFIC